MHFARQINKRLFHEHELVRGLLARAQSTLASAHDTGALRVAAARATLAELSSALSGEVHRHFAFEERVLFPPLQEQGEHELVELMLDEHRAIRETARALVPLIAALIAGDTIEDERLDSLRALGLTLCDSLARHSEREDAAMLPVLDATLDAAEDAALIDEYDAT